MLVDHLDYFQSGSNDYVATSGTTAANFDARKYPPSGKYADGVGEKILEFVIVSTTAAVGASFDFTIADYTAATPLTSFVARQTKTVALASCTAGAVIRMKIPLDLGLYVTARVTPASSMTGALTVRARIVHG